MPKVELPLIEIKNLAEFEAAFGYILQCGWDHFGLSEERMLDQFIGKDHKELKSKNFKVTVSWDNNEELCVCGHTFKYHSKVLQKMYKGQDIVEGYHCYRCNCYDYQKEKEK